MQTVSDLSEEELKSWMAAHGYPAFRAAQIFTWLYQKNVWDWEKMTDLSKSLREELAKQLSLNSLALARTLDSEDGETTKFLWKLSDEKLVESVLIRAPDRKTVCVSSQVGCPARCAFCASGKQGLIRNLSVAEVIEQIYQIERQIGEKITNVVFMGMGEPFENYDTVVKTIHRLIDPKGFNLSQRRITVSTVGLVPEIRKFAEEGLKVNLVLSLHAPNQRIRQKIIPYARKYDLGEILEAMQYFVEKTGRDITYEYTLMEGINDAPEHAKELAQLIKGHPCTINLIPYNPVEGLRLKRPDKEVIELFREILDAAGLNTTWRYTKGKDIAAACGQLALQSK